MKDWELDELADKYLQDYDDDLTEDYEDEEDYTTGEETPIDL